MKFDAVNAPGYRVWDDSTSRLVKHVMLVDDDKNQYAVCPPPIRVVNNEIVAEVRHAKVVVYHNHKLVVLNPKTVVNNDIAKSLTEMLSL